MLVVGVGGTHADDGGQAAFNLLVGVEPRWRAVAWNTDVKGDGIGVLRLAFVATGYGSRYTSTKASGKNVTVIIARASPDITE